jgi:hypothetical protein
MFGLNELKWSVLSGADAAAIGSMKQLGSEPAPGWNPLGELRFRMLRAGRGRGVGQATLSLIASAAGPSRPRAS